MFEKHVARRGGEMFPQICCVQTAQKFLSSDFETTRYGRVRYMYLHIYILYM